MLEFSNKLISNMEDYAESRNINIECRLVGSVAKNTSLKSKADIDIFMAFDLSVSEDNLKEYGLDIGLHTIEALGGDLEKRYASHPYYTGIFDKYEVDFVPCYKIDDSSQLKSAVDRTILHTDYIQEHMSDEMADEVLLLKKFASSTNTYGANYKVSGFSGYLCELLVLEYGSFTKVLEAASSNWKNSLYIDLEDHGIPEKFDEDIVVVDPVDKNRNVAAALTMQKYSEFRVAARNFLDKPGKAYFENRQIETSPEELVECFEDRATKTFILTTQLESLPTDVIYPQVNKTAKSLERVSRKFNFPIIRTGYYINNDQMSIVLEYEYDRLSNIRLHKGPQISDKRNGTNFKKKYDKAYVSYNRWTVAKKRDHTTVDGLVKYLLDEENMKILSFGKNVKEAIREGYEFRSVYDYIECETRKNLNDLFLYLNPEFNIER